MGVERKVPERRLWSDTRLYSSTASQSETTQPVRIVIDAHSLRLVPKIISKTPGPGELIMTPSNGQFQSELRAGLVILS